MDSREMSQNLTEYDELIGQLREHGIETKTEVLRSFFMGLADGKIDLLEQYGMTSRGLPIGIAQGVKERSGSMFTYSTETKQIEIDLESLNGLGHFMAEEHDASISIPATALPLEKWAYAISTEEAVHHLQDQGTEGFVPLPPQDERLRPGTIPSIVYRQQPHELQALRIVATQFTNRYPYEFNPFQQELDYITIPTTRDFYDSLAQTRLRNDTPE